MSGLLTFTYVSGIHHSGIQVSMVHTFLSYEKVQKLLDAQKHFCSGFAWIPVLSSSGNHKRIELLHDTAHLHKRRVKQ